MSRADVLLYQPVDTFARASDHLSINDAKMRLMRTTIDIPEELLRRAKAEAALRGLRLKDIVRDALRRLLLDVGRDGDLDRQGDLDEQTLAADCVFPLFTGVTGPAMRGLRGESAQRLLDEEDVDREVHPR